MKLAGAPISWGVCEVPDWGYQLPADRVLTEMRAAGLAATEFGPDGFLPADPSTELASRDLLAVGGFTPVVLHGPDRDPAPEVEAALDRYGPSGATVLVLAAAGGTEDYEDRPTLDAAGWSTLVSTLDRLGTLAAERGVLAVLHPHVGTMVETGPEVQRVLDHAAIPLCLDTGHLLIGGTDPAALARRAPDRIAHVHLKDVDAAVADRLRGGEFGYHDAVRAGLYRPLGDGDVDVTGIVRHLTDRGYDGWYVLEQDTVLAGPDADPVADVRRSLAHLTS